jgi:hypothetical protein
MTSREEWELMIEIGEDNPDLAWVHSSWDRWSEHISTLPGFRALRDREGLIIGTMSSDDVSLAEKLEGGWEEEMFQAELLAIPEPFIDLEPEVLPDERTTVLRVGGERPFWIEIETEAERWISLLRGHPCAVQISRSPGGFRERWLVPQALLRLGPEGAP